jgi:hypothetical protein
MAGPRGCNHACLPMPFDAECRPPSPPGHANRGHTIFRSRGGIRTTTSWLLGVRRQQSGRYQRGCLSEARFAAGLDANSHIDRNGRGCPSARRSGHRRQGCA